MKEKVAVVIDSTFYLPKKVIKDNDLKVVSLNVIEGENTYKELKIDNDFVFERLNKKIKLTTSQPAPSEFVSVYEECIKEGYERILVLTLSKGLSGTYQSAVLGKNMLDNKEIVHVFDTETAAYGNELLVFKLLDLMKETDSVDDLIKPMEAIIERTSLYFTVENLYNLQKGGRLSKTQAFVGTVLRVKPIIKIIDGKLKLCHKERTNKKLLTYLMGQIHDDPHREGNKLNVRIIQRNSEENAVALKALVEEVYENATVSVNDYIGPVFSIHIGDQGFGLAWFFE